MVLIRVAAVAIVASLFVPSLGRGSASASSAIRSEPGDPYNRPVRLPRPHMICVIGLTSPPQRICPARLAPPAITLRVLRRGRRRAAVLHTRAPEPANSVLLRRIRVVIIIAL